MQGRGQGAAEPAVTIAEGDVRELAGKALFVQGDALQRNGHVTNTLINSGNLIGEVLGTWSRIDRVTVSLSGKTVTSTCTCHLPSLCRHAVAVLLQWTRRREMFRAVPSADGYVRQDDPFFDMGDEFGGDDIAAEGAPAEAQGETLEEDYARLLILPTMQQLRAMAKARGVRVTASTKDDFIRHLAPALAEDSNIDAAIQKLSPDERVTLDAFALVTSQGIAHTDRMTGAYRVLGGNAPFDHTAPPAIDALAEAGLIFARDRYRIPSAQFSIPRAVLNRIPPRPDFIPHIDRKRIEKVLARSAGSRPRPRLGLEEVFQVIAHEVEGGKIATALQAPTRVANANPKKVSNPRVLKGTEGEPYPALLTSEDLRHLEEKTGEPAAMLEFAFQLMVAAGFILTVEAPSGSPITVDNETLQIFLQDTPGGRALDLLETWLSQPEAIDLRPIVGQGKSLNLHFSPYASTWYIGNPTPRSDEVRRLMTRILACTMPTRITSDEPWLDISSLVNLFRTLDPDLLTSTRYGNQQLWWFSSAKRPKDRLDLTEKEDWLLVWKPLITSILTGPMTWLRLVQTLSGPDGPIAFRFLPGAAVLAGRPIEGDRAVQGPLRFALDSSDGSVLVTIPAGSSASGIHGMFFDMAEFLGAGNGGLRYRLRPDAVRRMSEGGVSGQHMMEGLAALAGGQLPADVRATFERWVVGFGTVRLYDDVTLIEVADEILLRELDIHGSLHDAMVYRLSPTVVAVDGARLPDLLVEWKRLGHAPKVIAGA